MSLSTFIKRMRDITRLDQGINGDAQRIEQLTWMLFLKIYDDREYDWEAFDDDYESIIPEPCRWRNWADTVNDTALKGDALISFVDGTLLPTLKDLSIPAGCPLRKSIVKTVFTDIHNFMKDGVLLRQLISEINECDFNDPREAHAFGSIYESILKLLQSAGSSGEFYTPRALTDFMARHVELKLGDRVADFACGTGGFLNSAREVLSDSARTVEQRELLSRSFYGTEKKPLPYLLCVTNLLLHGVDEPLITYGNSLAKNTGDYTENDKFDVILMNPPYGGSEQPVIQQNFPGNMRSAETADLFIILIMTRLRATGRAAVVIPDGFLFGGGNKAEIKKELLHHFNLHTVLRLPGSVFSPYTSIATNVLFFNGTGPTKETWFYRVDMPEGYKHFSKTRPMLPEHFAALDAWWNHRVPLEENGADKARCYSAGELEERNFNFDLCGFPQEEEEILPPEELIARYQAERARHLKVMDDALDHILSMIGGRA
ncbi:class I SAM-dependent DNA methyltransferase [uncultured Mailhella sp.]|uniref:class I SAM-dependent DNA methyltransferase n=1 Tax=uncultured Mailhella sp. TaxID=1981031 RepID=UPI0025F816B5|nr:class I SAM-dependent DNA methyltransferase [uncultured Mailhella sp.]